MIAPGGIGPASESGPGAAAAETAPPSDGAGAAATAGIRAAARSDRASLPVAAVAASASTSSRILKKPFIRPRRPAPARQRRPSRRRARCLGQGDATGVTGPEPLSWAAERARGRLGDLRGREGAEVSPRPTRASAERPGTTCVGGWVSLVGRC